jgi:DnaJ-class molecular chaperone
MYTCPRCDGKGQISGYSHVMNGVCFKCSGAGKVNNKPRKPRAQRKPDPAIAKRNAEKSAKAKEMYKDDPRLRVSPDHQYYYMHAIELAQLDGIWETL